MSILRLEISLTRVLQQSAQRLQAGRRILGHVRESWQWQGCLVIPVGIKHSRGVARHRTNPDNIKIAELRELVGTEVLVCNVTATNNGHLAVYRERLRMHTPRYT